MRFRLRFSAVHTTINCCMRIADMVDSAFKTGTTSRACKGFDWLVGGFAFPAWQHLVWGWPCVIGCWADDSELRNKIAENPATVPALVRFLPQAAAKKAPQGMGLGVSLEPPKSQKTASVKSTISPTLLKGENIFQQLWTRSQQLCLLIKPMCREYRYYRMPQQRVWFWGFINVISVITEQCGHPNASFSALQTCRVTPLFCVDVLVKQFRLILKILREVSRCCFDGPLLWLFLWLFGVFNQ